ncbi:MAG: hypothetical protein ACFFGZ_01400 [Candidatus Thorarchaeota archaeon]
MVLSKENALLNVAVTSFAKGQPPFRFIGSNGKVVGAVENLAELITFLQHTELHPVVLQHHISKETTSGILDFHMDGSTMDIIGIPAPLSDLVMWILYVLGDAELAYTLHNLNQTIKDPNILKEKVLDECRKRERFLLGQIAKSANDNTHSAST